MAVRCVADRRPLSPTQEKIMASRSAVFSAVCALGLMCSSLSFAQELTVGYLKAKGATFLSAEELKAVLPGALLRYENAQFLTSMKLNTDGSLNGRSDKRVGQSGEHNPGFAGEWRISDEGRWCAVQRQHRGPELGKYCRDVLKVGEKFYYSAGNRSNDSRPAYELSVSK
jgi:hypothetical protein